MDWDLKIPSWDFSEFERESAPNISSLVGQSSLGGQKSKGNCSVDLKLGRFGDFGDGSVNKWKDPRDSTTVSSPMGSLKRARAPCSGTQTVSCLVEGCNVDLSKCRDYHRRHKVCEVHSKTPRVMVGGQEQRFCQQCSRFHSLVEFDEVKRSCRKRLDGHNRRRRKSQAESLSMNSGSSLSNHQGARLLPFSNPQVLPSTTVMSPSWIKTEQDTMPYNCYPSLHYVDRQNPFSDSFSRDYKVAGKQFPFLQANDSTLVHRTAPEASVCQPLLNTIATPETGGTNRKLFSNEFTQVLDSDCALSLLSSPRTQTSGISMNHVVQPDSIPLALPLVPGMQYSGLGRYQTPGMDDEPMGSVMVSDANNAEIRSQGIFHVRHDGSSSHGGVQETVPFSWE